MTKARTSEARGGTPEIRVARRLGKSFDALQARIRERAYQLFLARNGAEGDPDADWLAAELELVAPVDLDIKEHKKNIQVEARLQDFAPDEIEVEVQGDTLRMFGNHRETSAAGKSKRGSGQEFATRCVSFYRSVQLPAPVDAGKARAKLFKNGKLKVTLPRQSPLQ